MADPVRLDSAGYPGTYKLIGGSPALDFANLVSYRGTPRQHDWLFPSANLHRWAASIGLPATPGATTARLRELRETLARLFLAIADDVHPEPPDVRAVGDLAAEALGQRHLLFPPGASAALWEARSSSVLSEVSLEAAALLTSPRAVVRIAACEECRWLFIDRTRNRSRRWCDPADCGNRARQRRHYERRKTADR